MAGDVDLRRAIHHSCRSIGLEAVLLDQFIALGGLEVLAHHFGDEFGEVVFGVQPSFSRALVASPSRVSTSVGPEIARIDLDDALALGVVALLVDAAAPPGHG
jgi:hypothetical protein